MEKTAKKERSRNRYLLILILGVILIGVTGGILFYLQKLNSNSSVYQSIVYDGYEGTEEQFIASIIGEEVNDKKTKTAYEMACEQGYRKSEQIWIQTVTGLEVENVEKSPYSIAIEYGYEGEFVQWLNAIMDDPEKLGRSQGIGVKTEYELACEYGYTGTFIEWLVSMTYDKVF